LLVVDDEPYILSTLVAQLSPDFEVVTADCVDAAQNILQSRSIDIILTDQRMPRHSGVELLEWTRQNSPRTIRLLMTGYAELEDAVESINRAQVYHYLLKPWRLEDLLLVLRNAAEKFVLERSREQLLTELRELNEELERRVDERTLELQRANRDLQHQAEEMRRLALTDPLTGLFNRRAMDGLATAELRRHARYQNPLSIGLLDVDHFKSVNTHYTYPGGDAVLQGLARILTTTVREVVDSVGRVGGEEFLIIARETSYDGAVILAERIRSAVAETPIEYENMTIHVTASVGFAVAENGVNAEFKNIYALAAQALKEAKETGRNRSVVFRMPREQALPVTPAAVT
jgi:diguanylate cyclase (GGDEF)-like protein